MNAGDTILIPFPFSELTRVKARPALVVTTTKDKYRDLILCAISSVLPSSPTGFEIIVSPTLGKGLSVPSVIKVDRIMTLKQASVIARLGQCDDAALAKFQAAFKMLI